MIWIYITAFIFSFSSLVADVSYEEESFEQEFSLERVKQEEEKEFARDTLDAIWLSSHLEQKESEQEIAFSEELIEEQPIQSAIPVEEETSTYTIEVEPSTYWIEEEEQFAKVETVQVESEPEVQVQQQVRCVPSTQSQTQSLCASLHKSRPYQAFLRHTAGQGVGYDHSYTTLGVFLAPPNLSGCSCFPFFDMRNHIFNNSDFALNVGLGMRCFSRSMKYALGAHLFYDYRCGKRKEYQQFTFGIEYLSPCWDFRMNGYFPFGKRIGHSSLHVYDDYIGPFFGTCRETEASLAGVDAELGVCLMRSNPCKCRYFDLYAALGPYYYSNSHSCEDSVTGGRGRLLAQFCDTVSIELRGGYDNVYKGTFQVRFGINLPLCSGNKRGLQKASCCYPAFFYQPVERHEIIVLDEGCSWDFNWE